MTVFKERPIKMWLIMVVAIMGLAGCSADAPYESSNNETLVSGGPSDLMPPPAEGNVLFVAEVATIDQDQRMITFVDRDEVVIVAEDCQIVEIIAGVATDIEMLDIEVGMRLKVCGILQEDETVLAHKICVYIGNECYIYDLAFRDTIISIDYAAGSFTTANKTEIILVDESTVIWGVITEPKQGSNGGTDHGQLSTSSEEEPNRQMRVTYEFADLQIGNCLEIKANIVDENSLYAVSIKLANSTYRQCIEFESELASIDYVERTVTFEDNDWLGSICLSTELLNASGESITLEDFVSGELVSVKGFPTDDTILKICSMSKVE